MDNIRGLSHFAEHFRDWQEHYVLIGGVASHLAMDEAGLSFRTTKDIDIVLIVEALSIEFIAHFWGFIKAAGYQIRQKGGEQPVFYRFTHPQNTDFPVQIELFSRVPEGLRIDEAATLVSLRVDEVVSSLSAILLNEDYYAFLLEGRRRNNELVFISADRLIPFKARAWLDLSQRKNAGEKIDSRDIRKHRNDVLALTGLLTNEIVRLPDAICQDMGNFLLLLADEEIDTKALKITIPLSMLIARLRDVFGIEVT